MSFLEKIFGRNEESKEQILSIDDAESFLSRNFDERFKAFGSDANKIYQDMQSVAINMQESIRNLGLAEYKGPVDSELLQNVIGHRKSFINKMKIMTERVKRQMRLDFDSVLEFGKSTSASISETNENTVLDYASMKELFEKEAESVIENFKILSKISKRFDNLIDRNKEDMLSIRNIQRDLQSMKEELKNLEESEAYLKNLEAKTSDLITDCKNAKEELIKFKDSRDWLHFNELLDKKEDIENNLYKLKSYVMQDISKVEKPLRKFKNLVDRGSVKIENEKILKRYADSVFDTLIEEKNPEIINSILRMVENSISERKIELKDREKTLKEMKSIVDENVLGDFLEKYRSQMNELEKIEKNISEQDAPKIKDCIENRISGTERDIETKKMEIDTTRKQLERMKNSIEEKKINLEKSISSLAKRKVRMNFQAQVVSIEER